MSKPLRRQLADAHQENRRLENLLHENAMRDNPLRVRIAELERENDDLRARSNELAFRLFSIHNHLTHCQAQVVVAAKLNDLHLPVATSIDGILERRP